ncbi:MAG: hypothetical protein QNJ33_15685 [Crocosphaera sp.]|nr:hypothetical protein [Crocosphaera sp.]
MNSQQQTLMNKAPQDFHRILIDAQALRQISDYGKFQAISKQQAEQQVINAERFIDYALKHI